MQSRLLFLGLVLLLGGGPAVAQAPSKPKVDAGAILPLLGGGSPDALAGSLRGYLVQNLPNPLYEKSWDWGRQSETVRGLKWHGLHPELQKSPKNDGRWRRIHVDVVDPATTLVLDLRDFDNPEPGRITFTLSLAFDARVTFQRQTWENGHRLYSGESRARFRAKARLDCAATFHCEPTPVLVPDLVFRLRVTKSDVGYDNFVMEHTAGLGGDAAEIIGDVVRGGLKRFHPSLEHDLLAKADAAIEKAADTKEVRVSLYDVIKKKGLVPKEAK